MDSKAGLGWDLFQLKRIGFLTPGLQIVLISGLFALTTILGFLEYQRTGELFGYPLAISILFVPIYEELIFRGFILRGLSRMYSLKAAIIGSSLLFGLWHLKNIFYLTPPRLAYQMAYAVVLGLILAYVTVRTKTVWIAVILHYLNNLLAPLSLILLAKFF